MQTRIVIKEVGGIDGDVSHRFCMIGLVALPDTRPLQIQKEAFYGGAIPAIPFPAHACLQAVLGQHDAPRDILAPTIRMNNEAQQVVVTL